MDLVPRNSDSALISQHDAAPPAYGDPYVTQFPTESESSIFKRLRRQNVLFSVVFCGTLAAVAGAYLVLPRSYKAEAMVTISPNEQVLASLQPSDTQQLTVGDMADLESQAIVLASPMLLRNVLSQAPVQSALLMECKTTIPSTLKRVTRLVFSETAPVSCDEQLASATTMVERLRNHEVVGVSGRSRVLDVSFSSSLPSVAKIVANAIVQTYLALQTEERLQPRSEAIDWLKIESSHVADRLRQTEVQISSFLHANGVVKGQVAPIASEQLTSLGQQIAVAVAERAAAAGRMQQSLADGGATTGVLENRTVNDEKQQLSTVNAQIAQLSSRYGAAYPPLADLEQQRKALQRAVAGDTAIVAHSAVTDYQAASSRVSMLQTQMDQLKKEVRGNDDATVEVAALQRNLATDRELYLDLTKSLNQLETNRRLVTSNARLVSLAEEPQTVAFPKLSVFTLAGTLLALGFAAAASLLRDRADRTVRSVGLLQDKVHLRVLAQIPHVSGLGRAASRLTKRMALPSAFQEAIRGLYAECLLLSQRSSESRKRNRTILLASSGRSEGKSFTTLALAHFAAAAGRRVLVLECDLRQPSVARSLSLPAQWGLSEILSGQVSSEEAVREYCPGLDIITSGKAAMNSTELLSSSRMMAVLTWASSQYDLILIDTPPSRFLPDARILASMVDGVLFCTRWGHSDMTIVQRGVQELHAAGGHILGVVLGGINPNRSRLYDEQAADAGSYLALR